MATTGNILFVLSIAVPLCLLMAYRAKLEHQQTLAWMRLHSSNLGLSSHVINDPALVQPGAAAEPRRIHKLSIPVPRGAMPRPVGGIGAEAIPNFARTSNSAPATKP